MKIGVLGTGGFACGNLALDVASGDLALNVASGDLTL